ncbi:MAG: hypothetical protein JOY70_04090 [Acidisphaera sp.]|nr:hypothetical protein [Acidisphaera sp.]
MTAVADLPVVERLQFILGSLPAEPRRLYDLAPERMGRLLRRAPTRRAHPNPRPRPPSRSRTE